MNQNIPGRGHKRTQLIILQISGTVLFAILAAGIWIFCFPSAGSPGSDAAKSPDFTESNGKTPYSNPAGFVGPDACVDCHSERLKDFKHSRHYLACVSATDDTMPEVFKEVSNYTPHKSNVAFSMFRDGGEFFQVAEVQGAHDQVPARTRISLMYGYGAGTDEVYFSWSQNKLSELPMSWIHPQEEWGTSGFDRLGKGEFTRPTNPRCVECHNTWLEHVPGTPNEYRPESLIPGVTCEVCHGPAKEHVEFHLRHPGDDISPMHIVRPSQLSRSLQMDLCANCHSNALKHKGPTFSYRPGKALDEYYKTLVTLNPEDDHVANQTTYLKQSKCFQNSETLTCITCHDPHSVRGPEPRGTGESKCLSCHQQQSCKERPRLPEAVQDNCVGCHMPRRTKIQDRIRTLKSGKNH